MSKEKIARPSIGRIVIYTLHRDGDGERAEENAGIIVGIPAGDMGVVDVEVFGEKDSDVFGSSSIAKNVNYDAFGRSRTWRYPDRVDATIDVNDDGRIV